MNTGIFTHKIYVCQKRIICVLMLAVFVLVCASGCGESQSAGGADTEAETAENNAGQDSIVLYYVNSDWSDYASQNMEIDQLATTESLIDSVMTHLLEGSGDDAALTPVPHGMTFQRYTYDGYGQVSLIFNIEWETTDTYELALCKSAFVKSLCQIDKVTSVGYEMTDIVNEDNVVTEECTPDTFASLDNILQSQGTTTIYLPDTMGTQLVKKELTIDLSAAQSVPEQVIAGLKMEFDGATSPFNSRTVVKLAEVEDGVCTVTMNEYFTLGKDGVDDEIAIYSIVNSLVELDGIDSVKFVVENSDKNVVGKASIDQIFTGNYSNVVK